MADPAADPVSQAQAALFGLTAQADALRQQLIAAQAQGLAWNEPAYQVIQSQYNAATAAIPAAYQLSKDTQNQVMGIIGSSGYSPATNLTSQKTGDQTQAQLEAQYNAQRGVITNVGQTGVATQTGGYAQALANSGVSVTPVGNLLPQAYQQQQQSVQSNHMPALPEQLNAGTPYNTMVNAINQYQDRAAYNQIIQQGYQGRAGFYGLQSENLGAARTIGDSQTQAYQRAMGNFGQVLGATTGYTPAAFGSEQSRTALALEYQRAVSSRPGIDTRETQYYSGELQKTLHRPIEKSSEYHYVGQKLGVPVPANPFEAQGDIAVEILKGSPGSREEWFSPLSGLASQYLPGMGVQEQAWQTARTGVAPQVSFMPALGLFAAAEGQYGPYGSLFGGPNYQGTPSSEGIRMQAPFVLTPEIVADSYAAIRAGPTPTAIYEGQTYADTRLQPTVFEAASKGDLAGFGVSDRLIGGGKVASEATVVPIGATGITQLGPTGFLRNEKPLTIESQGFDIFGMNRESTVSKALTGIPGGIGATIGILNDLTGKTVTTYTGESTPREMTFILDQSSLKRGGADYSMKFIDESNRPSTSMVGVGTLTQTSQVLGTSKIELADTLISRELNLPKGPSQADITSFLPQSEAGRFALSVGTMGVVSQPVLSFGAGAYEGFRTKPATAAMNVGLGAEIGIVSLPIAGAFGTWSAGTGAGKALGLTGQFAMNAVLPGLYGLSIYERTGGDTYKMGEIAGYEALPMLGGGMAAPRVIGEFGTVVNEGMISYRTRVAELRAEPYNRIQYMDNEAAVLGFNRKIIAKTTPEEISTLDPKKYWGGEKFFEKDLAAWNRVNAGKTVPEAAQPASGQPAIGSRDPFKNIRPERPMSMEEIGASLTRPAPGDNGLAPKQITFGGYGNGIKAEYPRGYNPFAEALKAKETPKPAIEPPKKPTTMKDIMKRIEEKRGSNFVEVKGSSGLIQKVEVKQIQKPKVEAKVETKVETKQEVQTKSETATLPATITSRDLAKMSDQLRAQAPKQLKIYEQSMKSSELTKAREQLKESQKSAYEKMVQKSEQERKNAIALTPIAKTEQRTAMDLARVPVMATVSIPRTTPVTVPRITPITEPRTTTTTVPRGTTTDIPRIPLLGGLPGGGGGGGGRSTRKKRKVELFSFEMGEDTPIPRRYGLGGQTVMYIPGTRGIAANILPPGDIAPNRLFDIARKTGDRL